MRKVYYKTPDPPAEDPYLIGSQCRQCLTVFFPPKHVCPVCGKEGTMNEKPLSRRGKIYSFSCCAVAPKGVTAPYIIGLVDLPEGPRLASIITVKEPSPTALGIGDDVELIIGKTGVDEQGQDIINYLFKPVKDLIAPQST